MVERRLARRDQAGLPQPARASLLASTGKARETHATQETTAAGTSFFAFLSHIARSQHKRRISHQTSDRNSGTLTGDWWWRVYTTTTTTTTGVDPTGKLIVRTYIWCLLPQLLWCMPLHVMFLLPTTSLHLVCPVPCCMCWLGTICTAILAKYMYACAYTTYIPSVGGKNNACYRWCMRTWSASGLIAGCAHALLGMWVRAYFCDMKRTLGTD